MGQHNLYNLLAALIVAERLGCSIDLLVTTLSQLTPAPGRLEPVLKTAPLSGLYRLCPYT